jgi:hypothetical protein
MTKSEKLDRLSRAYEDDLRIPFPGSSDDEYVGDLHGELVQYAAYIASIVDRVLDGEWTGGRVEFDHNLEQRIEAAAKSDRPGADDAKEYLPELRELKHLLELAMDVQLKA